MAHTPRPRYTPNVRSTGTDEEAEGERRESENERKEGKKERVLYTELESRWRHPWLWIMAAQLVWPAAGGVRLVPTFGPVAASSGIPLNRWQRRRRWGGTAMESWSCQKEDQCAHAISEHDGASAATHRRTTWSDFLRACARSSATRRLPAENMVNLFHRCACNSALPNRWWKCPCDQI